MSTSPEEVAATAVAWVREGRRAVVGRVMGIRGFSTWPGDQMVVVDEAGQVAGEILGAPGTAQVVEAVSGRRTAGAGTVTVSIHGAAVAEAGLSCGGQAEILLQDLGDVPDAWWTALAGRTPVALVTPVTGGDGSPVQVSGPSQAVLPDQTAPAAAGPATAEPADDARTEALRLLADGTAAVRQTGGWLVESWVPAPRIVVVGDGDLVAAITAQAGLLGWETRATPGLDGFESLLGWAGASARVVVLSHDAEIDTPALATALAARAPYVGALGSRRTQGRRLERLRATGLADDVLDRIHRPIGLDLGGRGAAEVALSICAEILADRHHRDPGPLRDSSGRIRERPALGAA